MARSIGPNSERCSRMMLKRLSGSNLELVANITPLRAPALHDRISAIFVERLQIAVPSTETDLIQMGILDSLQLVDLILSLETEFGIRISLDDLDLESFRSIARIADLIENQMA